MMKDINKPYFIKSEHFVTSLKGESLLNQPVLNKDTAFTEDERLRFGLEGLLPPHVDDLGDQVSRCYEAFNQKDTLLEKHIYLRQLQDRNETLFYRLVIDYLTEMMPIIYTPVVGEACQLFSHIYRRPRGLFISYPERANIDKILENSPIDDVKVIVVTDGERILGLGDQGVGGMGIPIGKLSLYSACGGIRPMNTLPIILDVGTNSEKKHSDPTYMGWRHKRIVGDEYYRFVDKFVQAVKKCYPNVLLQFEDFAQPHAYPLLEKYQDQLCCFNDDIQGTASVCASAILAAVKSAGSTLDKQRVAVLGAGSAGCGISEQLVRAMTHYGLSEEEARTRFYMVDRNGLLLDTDNDLLTFQKGLVQSHEKLANWKLKKSGYIGLDDVMKNAQPTILLGVSAQPNQFTETIVKDMAKHTERPIIFPMSNPTSRCEAKPEDLIKWTDGKALVATGSPFDDVKYKGKTYRIAQSNNCYIFPGMGLAVLSCGAKRVTNEMFMAASLALSEAAPALHTEGGALLPDLATIRDVSKKIAFAAAKEAMKQGHANTMSDDRLKEEIDETMWNPKYRNMRLET